MSADRFVDTNVLLYAVSTDPLEAGKSVVARSILDGRDVGLSVQVLQEFYVQATRPRRASLSHEQACRLIEAWLRFPVQELTTAVMCAALRTKERFQVSYWDAAIIEAAKALGCHTILTEDLSAGQDYGGVRVENPFAGVSV